MTAADAAYSIASAMGSEYYGSRLRFIIEAQAQDDLTLVLATSEAYECLPLLLDIPIIKAGTKDDASPMGTGPYEFADTKLVRCQNWWQDSEPLADFDEIALTISSTAAEVRDNFEYQKVNMVLTDPNSSAFAGFHNDYEIWDEETTIMQYSRFSSVICSPTTRPATLESSSRSASADSETVTTSDRFPFSSAIRQVMILVRLAG